MADFSAPINSGGGSRATEGFGSNYEGGTLDEPVMDTIMRDVRMVGSKMMCVLNPRKANIQTLKDWDLWGPLLLCLMLATLLSWCGDRRARARARKPHPSSLACPRTACSARPPRRFAPYEQKSLVFASVFVIIWCRARPATPPAARAPPPHPGGLAPPSPRLGRCGAAVVTVNALLLGGNISFFQSICVLGYCIFPLNVASVFCLVSGHILWRCAVVGTCFLWSTGASLGFMGELVPPNRKALAVYPLFLFYTAIGWLILSAAKR